MSRRFFAVPFLTLAVACGGGEVEVTSVPIGGSGASSGVAGSSSTTTGTGGSGGTGGSPGFAGGPTCSGQGALIPSGGSGGKVGAVELITYRASDAIDSSVTALFASGGDANGTADCQLTKIAPCVVRACPSVPASPTSRFESAGTLSVTGGLFPVSLEPKHTSTDPVMMTQGVDYAYALSTGKPLFSGEEMLIVSTTGAAVPGFTATVVAPSAVTLLTPADAATVDPGAPLALTWMAAGSDTYVVVDLATTTCNVATHVICTFPVKDGAGTIPAAALTTLHGSVSASVSGLGTASLNAGDYSMTIDVHDRTGSPPRTLSLP
jgi:hypothetical protein